MQELRTRFVRVLALALLPLLIFAIWQAYSGYKENQNMRAAILDDTAVETVTEIIDVIDNLKAILKLLGSTITPENCARDVELVTQNFPKIYNVVVSDGEANLMCAALPIRATDPLENAITKAKMGKPFDISLAAFAENSDGPSNILIVSHGVETNGEITKAVLAGVDISVLSSLRDRSSLADGVLVTLYGPNGNIYLGPNEETIEVDEVWTSIAKQEGRYNGKYIDSSGEKREVTVLPTSVRELLVAISVPDQAGLNTYQIHPLLTAAIPLLAWGLGCMVIWLTTDRLLLSHIREIRSGLMKFTMGDMDARVDLKNNPPESIRELEVSFNRLTERVGQREGELRESLEEKETLLREIHHRVKNNLQIITSLLNMQERKVSDPSALLALQESKNRINAIALVHQALYESEDIRFIPIDPFLRQMIKQLSRVLLIEKRNIKLKMDISCSPMDSDRATPLALFIVEALTNSVKHGVVDGGEINLDISEVNDTVIVNVKDNGSGVSASGAVGPGTGSRLMKGFARQLSGNYGVDNTATGHSVTLSFPAVIQVSPSSHIR